MERFAKGSGAVVLVVVVLIASTWAPDVPGATTGAVQDVAIMSGGVGKEEADAMRAAASDYPLQFTFVRNVGDREEFIADVRLTIADKAGHVLVDQKSGPLVLVRLPDGIYTVSAEYAGQQKTRRVAIGEGRRESVAMVWS